MTAPIFRLVYTGSISFSILRLSSLSCLRTELANLWSLNGNIIAGEQKRARRLILTLVVSGTFLKRRADLKQNVGTFLAFLCSSNWNEWYVSEWYVSKWWNKGPGVEFKIRGRVM